MNSGAKGLPQGKRILSIADKDFFKTGKSARSIGTQQEFLILHANSLGLVAMLPETAGFAHPRWMGKVEATPRAPANSFVCLPYRPSPPHPAIRSENKDSRTKQVDFGMLFKVLNLSRKALRISNIVPIHSREILPCT